MENLFIDLLQKYKKGTLSASESKEFQAMLASGRYSDILAAQIDGEWGGLTDQSDPETLELMYQHIQLVKETQAPVRKINFWKRVAVAASIILVLGAGSYFLFFNKVKDPNTQMADVLAPQANRATITLSGGKLVYLDSAQTGSLAKEGEVNLVKLSDGKIEYSGTASELTYHTLTNPRGSKVINMTLADGSRVWLNAGSSITYPVAFINPERKVSMTGEAFFEISKDASKRFIVEANGISTEVLGTQFNVNAYPDEFETKVSLIEGSVKVSRSEQTITLKPNQQASIREESLSIAPISDIEKTLAWRNNEFVFSDDRLEDILRELARWYDIEPIITVKSATNYTGRITRTVPLSQVLGMFEKLGYVKFEIKGKEVSVISLK